MNENKMIDGNHRFNTIKNMAKEHMEMEKETGEVEHNPDLIEQTGETLEQLPKDRQVTKPGRGRPAKVDKQVFIEAWNNASDLTEVASMLGMPRTSASVKASQLRKSGCELKLFPRGRKNKDAIQVA